MAIPNCPKCDSAYVYEDGNLLVCPECAHEWNEFTEQMKADEAAIRDVNGTVLQDGDDVVVIKDLKVQGSANAIKQGTMVKAIRLIENPSDGHDIDCKIDGFGAMKLKSEFVKKA